MPHNDDPDHPPAPSKWYANFPKSAPPLTPSKVPSAHPVADLKVRAEKALAGETSAYELKQSRIRGSDYAWLKTALSRGTASDKVAASVVLIQDSPKHNLARLAALVAKVKLSKGDHCNETMNALKDLFLNDLLHPDTKLVRFEDQDFEFLQSQANQNKLLAHWYFEDQLKLNYESFLEAVTDIAANSVETSRERAVGIFCDLLIGNPEQEQKLLSNLVNKIGDPSAKVSSKAVFCLQRLLQEHPNMKGVVLNEVERLLFRPNVSPRVQYYAICLLTQFVLDREDEELATGLVQLYFAFFKACLKKGEPKSKMMGAILSGVNRAYKFARVEGEKIKEHVDAVFKVVHVGSFGVALSALNLLFQVSGKNPEISDRFYTAFYRKLFDPQITTASKRAVFLNLYLRAVRQDKSVVRAAAFVKRMLQVALYCQSNMVCAVLFVISQIVKSRRDLRRLFTNSCIKQIKQEKLEAEGEIEVVELEDKEDSPESKETKKNKKKRNKKKKEEAEKEKVQEEEATFEVEEIKKEEDIILSNVTVGASAEDVKPEIDVKEEECKLKDYDPFCRNPLHAGGYNAFFTEINALVTHFHPSVELFAKTIMKDKPIEYTGDPLKDLTTIRFLDRYVFKNPKQMTEADMKKKRDPMAKGQVYDPKGARRLAVDSASYLNIDERSVPVDELFLHRYLRMKRDAGRKTKDEDEDDEDDDNDSVNSEEFNEMLDRMAGAGEDDDDLDELDVAADYVEGAKKKGKASKDEDDEKEDEDVDDEETEDFDDEDLEDLDDEELEDEEMDEGEMDKFVEGDFGDEDMGSDLDLDELDDEASDIDFDEEEEVKKPKKGKKGKKKDLSDVFMSAEKFAEMLEEQGSSKIKAGMSNTMSDADGSNYKQLKWEMKRHQKLSGKNFGKKGKGKGKRLGAKQSGRMNKKVKR